MIPELTPVMNTPLFDAEDLVGCTFLMDGREDGQRFHAQIIELIKDHQDQVENQPELIKFRIQLNDKDKLEEIISYNQMLDYISRKENDNDVVWKF